MTRRDRSRAAARPVARAHAASALAVLALAAACGERPTEVLPTLPGRIAFASLGNGQRDIFVMRADGTGATNVTNDANDEDRDPVWSPDGRRIAFTHYAAGDYDIWVMDADGSNRRNVTNDPLTWTLNPTWSPDGSRLAFNTLERGGADTDVQLINVDGTGRTPLGRGIDPTWSPDGAWLAFRGNEPLGSPIVVARADGTERRTVSPPGAYDVAPAWSPDGRELAFVAGSRLGVMAVDGTGRRLRPGAHAINDNSPAWSPDGRWIVFHATSSGHAQLFVVGRDLTPARQLTFDGTATAFGADNFQPTWGVDPQ